MSLSVDIEKKLGNFHLRSRFTAGAETMALLGASGCGKSLTLKCIAGIVTPDRGRIVLDGRVLFDSERKIDLTPQQRQIGYLFQQYALFPHMTVEQNILCGIRAEKRREKRALAHEALRSFRLEGLEKKYPSQLSGGQQQRAALARILCSEPKAILLDEPFSALDGFLKWNLELELSDLLSGFRGPVIWVSHDRDECRRNCGSVCVMEDGVAGAQTDMEEMLRHPATIGAAKLSGCRNFFRAEAREDGVYLPEWEMTLPFCVSEKAFTTLAIPDDAVRSGGEMRFAVVRRIADAERDALLLRPLGAKDGAAALYVRLPKGTVSEETRELSLAWDAERLLFL